MPRFTLPFDPFDHRDPSGPDPDADRYDDLTDLDEVDEPARYRRRRAPRRPPDDAPLSRPRLVSEGRSGRATPDVDDVAASRLPDAPTSPYSSYDVATRGPEPAPGWLVTALAARDTPLGALKSGKEADVGLLQRAVPGGASCLLAVKTYRSAEHRMFHRDAGYLEGRRVRRSRETRALARRTAFGRELAAGQWAVAEFGALCSLWSAGARVPYPVQLIGSELMMQFIGSPDGMAAPRLAAHEASTAAFGDLWHDLIATLEVLAAEGMTHGDLSAYNVLVDEDGCVLIDLPQVVDLIGNPQGMTFLRRDCRNIAAFFARRGVPAADGDMLADHLGRIATPAG